MNRRLRRAATAIRTYGVAAHGSRVALLRAAIAATPHPTRPGAPISVRQFAATVVLRDPSTVRDWLSGASPIPTVIIPTLSGIVRDAAERASEVGDGAPSRVLASAGGVP